ncbi:MAG TPA: hypothetical protein H9829_02990 [Candidatus Tetragenococcus pullicola]|nr:hypothetical protein [Candidatus Tetragenococcus pullicola]
MNSLLDRYKKGQLSKKENEEVASKISEFKEYYDFVMSEEESELLEKINFESSHTDFIEEEKRSKKKVNRRIRKLFIYFITITITLITLGYFLVPMFFEAAYFNPQENTEQGIIAPFETTEILLNELSIDEPQLSDLSIQKNGLSNYTIYSQYYDSFQNKYTTQTNTISRNHIELSAQQQNKQLFGYSVTEQDGFIQKIKEIPDSSRLKIKLIFKSPQDIDYVRKLTEKYPDATLMSGYLTTKKFNAEVQVGNGIGIRFNDSMNNTLLKEYPSSLEDLLGKSNSKRINYSQSEIDQLVSKQIEEILRLYSSSRLSLINQDSQEKITKDALQNLNSDITNQGSSFSGISIAMKKEDLESILSLPESSFVFLQDITWFSYTIN